MGRTMRLVIALLVVGVLGLAGCDPRGGGDPRDAPGCAFGSYRCDGEVLQICQIDTVERRNAWWDVHDCVEFGEQVGKVLACVEPGASSRAECAEAVSDAGVEAGSEAGYVSADCLVGKWRCHEGFVQACDRAAQGTGTAWWDVWDCREQTERDGQPSSCLETDASVGAECSSGVLDGEAPDAGQ